MNLSWSGVPLDKKFYRNFDRQEKCKSFEDNDENQVFENLV